ncbi:MAG: PEP-CTERM sorting domain-containing protein [Microcystaceae cyanobacterium]
MKKLLSVLTPLTLMSVASVAPANAVVIAGWNDFDTGMATFPVAADTTDSNVSSAELNFRNLDDIEGNFGFTDWNTESSLDLTQYIEFEVAPTAGFDFDFTNLQLNARQDDTNLDLTLRSSIDGFSSDLGTIDLAFNFTTYTLDLSSLAPQSSAVQFRLYGTNADGGSVFLEASDSANVDGGGFIAINGDVNPTDTPTTPEPIAVIGLIVFGAVGALSRRSNG